MILVLDDDGFHLNVVKEAFPHKKIMHFTDSIGFLNAVKHSKNLELAVIDLWIERNDIPQEKFVGQNPKIEGILVAERLRKINKKVPVVLSTRFATHEIFVRAKYLNVIPVEIPEDAAIGVTKLRELFPELVGKNLSDLFKKFREVGFVTNSPRMLEVLEQAYRWKDIDEPLLITGETGTGKDTLAKAIHKLSSRKDKPFINFVISAYPKDNLHAKLFGVKDRSFTGVKGTPGVLESVGKGTLVLNEIGDLSTDAQIELLQVIEERIFYRMADNTPKKFQGRFILLTHKNLEQMVQSGEFRKDLYRRIMGFHIEIPPLRERREDIPELIEYFAPELNFTGSAIDFLMNNYDFPENVGSLYKIVKLLQSQLQDRNTVTLDDVLKVTSQTHNQPDETYKNGTDDLAKLVLNYLLSNDLTLKDFEKMVIKRAYDRFGYTWRKETWGKLGISRTTFYRKRLL